MAGQRPRVLFRFIFVCCIFWTLITSINNLRIRLPSSNDKGTITTIADLTQPQRTRTIQHNHHDHDNSTTTTTTSQKKQQNISSSSFLFHDDLSVSETMIISNNNNVTHQQQKKTEEKKHSEEQKTNHHHHHQKGKNNNKKRRRNHRHHHHQPDIIDYECDQDFYVESKMLLDQIQVATLPPLPSSSVPVLEGDGKIVKRFKILCFVMTYSESHETRIKDVLSTWGKRCDKLLLASDIEDPNYNTIAMNSESTWNNLWNKLNETLHYIYLNYYNDYDWFLKADDDSYVIIENLHAFLHSKQVQQDQQQVQQQNDQQVVQAGTTTTIHQSQQQSQPPPLVYGRRFGMPMKNVRKRISDTKFVNQFLQRYGNNKTLLFNSGGAGYVFNQPYLHQLIQALNNNNPSTATGMNNDDSSKTEMEKEEIEEKEVITAPRQDEKCPEDVGQSITSLYYSNIIPQNSRDEYGKERFHFSHPNDMYMVPYKWAYGFHKFLGGISTGLDCCSNQTITFHWMDKHPGYMQYVEKQLYDCRK